MEILTGKAKEVRAAYYKNWKRNNPEKVKASAARYWENKAVKIFGSDYKSPAPGEDMSEHARAARRQYYATRRKANPGEGQRNSCRYWEKKAGARTTEGIQKPMKAQYMEIIRRDLTEQGIYNTSFEMVIESLAAILTERNKVMSYISCENNKAIVEDLNKTIEAYAEELMLTAHCRELLKKAPPQKHII